MYKVTDLSAIEPFVTVSVEMIVERRNRTRKTGAANYANDAKFAAKNVSQKQESSSTGE